VTNIWQRYLKNTGGHFAVQFALLGLPLIVATTFVVDYAGAGTEKVNVKAALDAAVIAAVNNNSLTLSEKEAYATQHFNKNYTGSITLELTPKASDTRVEMSAFGVSPVTVAETLGIDGIQIFEQSAAVQTSENVICVLSTAKDGADRITFRGRSTFNAPSCSVHANSDDVRAMRVVGNAHAVAKSFCAAGGSSGTFQPYAKGECARVADPYANRRAPEPGPCINIGDISDVRSVSGSETLGPANGGTTAAISTIDDGGEGASASSSSRVENLIGSNVYLAPGTYCGGLTVNGENVRFLPGDHIILDGPLIFKNKAQVDGDGVSFVMNGLDSTVTVQSGASVALSAPTKGPLSGLVFFQDVQTQFGADGVLPNGINSMSSGGQLNITGTAYFPTQTMQVTSNAVFGSHAPATSFIAYDIHFGGNAAINVAVDHKRAGLPPIMPRTEDGARLVQ
jgi:hypothetical protein